MLPDPEPGGPQAPAGPALPVLGRLAVTDPRTVWAHEAHTFTPWLLANPDYLTQALEIELELTAAEHPVGPFNLDLIGRDLSNGGTVLIVENQLATSDHGHLGQLLTYAAGTGAGTIVWIATQIRDQHRQAIDWLNEHTDETIRLFAIELQVVRIGDSPPAAVLKVVAKPNASTKLARAATTEATTGAKAPLYLEFWSQLLPRVQTHHPTTTWAKTPVASNWFCFKAVSCYQLNMSFAAGNRLRSEIYIDSTTTSPKSVFDRLALDKPALESAYGRSFEWDRMDGRRACRLVEYSPDGDLTNKARWGSYMSWFEDTIERWLRVLALPQLRDSASAALAAAPVESADLNSEPTE